ncbi:Mur ligase family protein [Bifidobacterium eulemuris]|uniref:UDP-N-acetylmuramoyl-L-alanyl-D-glutamate--2, 6-diaminopimelate ligase n=1 Tax=Bifidobacterium eulemuris TaxID=1765219 RepID=A0A261G7L6_9BIFI|nr:Mur ligase family protein [Bifidobacterium eulemuris]OZG67412.1 UDP-N-acetylmuramoylalanyl-D-glutamate--2,6- diam inopimelate ligase [Bifidobacterium eulemuris]QOL32981.1 UDP-N-acetylmuramoyl-L-alanyl-D-glutamate--2,6-diaminopimelate ligase [Bifidobacterium eulemuris]
MNLTLASMVETLKSHRLLREIIHNDIWTDDIAHADTPNLTFDDITYDSRQVGPRTLLFCKGNFRPEYLDDADKAGLPCYVAQTDHSAHTKAVGLIVDDVRAAMALLAAEFHGRPQDELTVVGITGTKGKTTTAYFTHAILNAHSGGRAALLSSVDNCVDGRTWSESELTTPESLDLYRLMRQAADNGMRYLVMEVSSQAYKLERVHGLTFDAAAFLNISPDHISPIEHPTFEDYLHNKRQIVFNCRSLVLGADCTYADLIRDDARDAEVPVRTFAVRRKPDDDVDLTAEAVDVADSRYLFRERGETIAQLSLALEGEFNAANAAAAIALARQVGVPSDSPAFAALEQVRISGRMEHYSAGNIEAYVDYAHNHASAKTLVDFIAGKYAGRNPRVIAVTGSVGDKAMDRREGIITGLQDGVDRIILTQEDTVAERMIDICHEMQGYLTNPRVACDIELDRAKAIALAVEDARAHPDQLTVLLVIGKGDERWIKIDGQHVPYEGDDHVVRRLLGLDEA